MLSIAKQPEDAAASSEAMPASAYVSVYVKLLTWRMSWTN